MRRIRQAPAASTKNVCSFCTFSLFLCIWLMTIAATSLLGVSAVSAAEVANSPTPVQSDVVYENHTLRNGQRLDHLRLHYATLGKAHYDSSGAIDNAILVLHWTGNSGSSVLTPEYMEALFSNGRPLDANRYYLIFPDNLGHGRSTKQSDGLKARFPHYGYNDLVDLQHKLVVETLGIKRLHAILGMSMGGMNAWQWAEAYPDEVEAIMPVVCLPAPISGRNLLWRHLAMAYIRNDPAWRNGDYTRSPLGYTEAYLLLRMMIDGVSHLQATIPDATAAEKFIASVSDQVATSDANDLLYSLESSSDYDPGPGLERIKTKTYALNFLDDEFNPDSLNILETEIRRVKNGRYFVQQGSSNTYGHLTMVHPALWADHVQKFMDWLDSRR